MVERVAHNDVVVGSTPAKLKRETLYFSLLSPF